MVRLRLLTIQPSEFGKITTAVTLAWFISSRGERMKEFGNFVVSMLIVAVPAGLGFLEPDLGSTMVYLSTWLGMMIVARTRIIYRLVSSWPRSRRYTSPGHAFSRITSASGSTRS